ncbi:MAG: AMP-binding protein, partial [Proteobacteria bacterium]|nr:AMP-binding protein [Pseudomonadota bacterium]
MAAAMFWPHQTLATALANAARERPAQEALVIAGRRKTYAQLWADVQSVAAALHATGVKRGDHVAVCMGNSIEWVVFFYAAATLGAVTVPVNTRFKADEFEYCLKQADVKLLFVTDRFLKINFIDMLRSFCPAVDSRFPDAKLPMLNQVVVLGDDVPKGATGYADFLKRGANAGELPLAAVQPDDVLLMQFTSGTTSYPKGVMLSHDNMLRNAAYIARRFDCRAGD